MRIRAWFILPILLGPALAYAAEPTPEQIGQAIRELSDRSFQVREKAAKFLWQAGESAELPLQRALQNGDPEVVRRARAILDRFDRGEHPDTPKDILTLLQQHRDGNQTTRLTVLEQLVEKGRHGFRALRRLARNRDFTADRPLIGALLVKQAPRQVPHLIVNGDLAAAQEWLEFCLSAPGVAAFENYAALMYLRKELAMARAFWQAEPANSVRTLALAHLVLAQQDWSAARPLVEATKDQALLDRLGSASSDWQRVSTVSAALQASNPNVNQRCSILAACKLTGATAAYYALTRRLLEKGGSTPHAARLLAQTFVQLGDWPAAEQILRTNAPADPFLFEILAERQGERIALEWAHRQKLDSVPARLELDGYMARRLFLLGNSVEAGKLSASNVRHWREAGQATAALRWVHGLNAVGANEDALAHATAMLEVLRREEADDGAAELFAALFGGDAPWAAVWWHYLRVAQNNEDALTSMRHVQQIVAGANRQQLPDWANDLIDSWRSAQNGNSAPALERRDRRAWAPLAAAEALHRAGLDMQAEAAFRVALQATPALAATRFADYLMAKRRFTDAATMLHTAWQTAPFEPMLLFLRGRALVLANEKIEGERLQDLAHWVPLADLRLRWQFHEQLQHRGFLADAQREADIAMAIGNHADACFDHFLLAGADYAERKNDFARATKLATQALAWNLLIEQPSVPRFVLARQVERCRVLALLTADNKDGFLREFRAALARTPNAALAIVALSESAKRQVFAEVSAAAQPVLKHLDQRCRDFPTSAWAANEYAWFTAHLKSDLDTALVRAKMAVASDPHNTAYRDTLAEVHFRRGERDQALANNRECLRLQPQREYYRQQRERFEKRAADSFPPR